MTLRPRFPATARVIALSLATFLTTVPLSAQESAARTDQTQLLLNNPTISGGFGGIDVRATRLAGKTAALTGARGAWLIGQRLSLGAAVWWNATPRINDEYTLPSGSRAGLGFGFGGLEVGWTFNPSCLVHVTASTLLGAGGTNYYDLKSNRSDFERSATDAFFVAEPALGLELNVSRHVRLVASGGYRFTAGARLEALDNKSFQGVSGGLTLKVGRF